MPTKFGNSLRKFYGTKSSNKIKYARKRQSANVASARSMYTRYRQPTTLSSSTTYPVRSILLFNSITSGLTFSDGLVSFSLASLPNVTEYTALFDHYKVNKMVVRFEPTANQVNPSTPCDTKLLTAVDFDGGATGLSYAAFTSYETCQVTPMLHRKSITIQPRAETATIDNGSTNVNAVVAPANTWFDCSNTGVNFYGVRYAMIQTALVNVRYDIWVEVFLTFKTSR